MEEKRRQRLREGLDTLVVCGLLAFTFMAVICAKPQLIGGNGAYMVLGNSMEPVFSQGDMVVTRTIDTIEIGDIITFADEKGRYVSHRVIEVSDWFKTKGDACEGPDTWIIPPEAVSGEYWFKFPFLGYVVAFVKSKYFLLFASIPIGCYLLVTRTWETYELLTKARETTDRAVETGRAAWWWLVRLMEAHRRRTMWWRRVLFGDLGDLGDLGDRVVV